MLRNIRSKFAVRTFFVLALVFMATFSGALQTIFGQGHQLSLADILVALRSKKAVIEEKNRILTDAVRDRGITFALTPEIEKELGNTGAYRDLIDAIRTKATPPPREPVAIQKPEPPKVDIPAPKPTPAPPDYAFYRNRATNYLNSGDLDLAITDLGKALEFKPTDARSYVDRGMSFAKQNKIDAAFSDFDKAIELDTKNSMSYFGRAQMLEKLGNADRAISDYDKAYTLDATNDQARASAIRLRESQAQAAKKIEPPKPAVESAPEPKVVPVGALNSYASNLAIPIYSAIDRRIGNQGRVTVQITLDEDGKVLSAQATDGPKSLRLVSEDAVRKSRFKPVKVGDKNVKVSGYIVYNFVANQ